MANTRTHLGVFGLNSSSKILHITDGKTQLSYVNIVFFALCFCLFSVFFNVECTLLYYQIWKKASSIPIGTLIYLIVLFYYFHALLMISV